MSEPDTGLEVPDAQLWDRTIMRDEGSEARMKPTEAAQRAKDHLTALTGLEALTVSSLDKVEAGWSVTVEMLELKKIPDSHDVLGSYACVVDDDGNLLSYKRTLRYRRSDVMEERTV